MVPVKNSFLDTYYKQKTGRVMKNILRFVMLLFCWDVYAATTQFDVSASDFSGMPDYLLDAAHAWSGIFESVGTSGAIASYVHDIQSVDVAKYIDAISVLGFNNTAMAIYEINNHIDRAFSVINTPLIARRSQCEKNLANCVSARRTLVVDGHVFGNFADFDSGKNGDFKTKNTGFSVNAKGYVADGWLFGVQYTRSMTDTHDTRVYSDATGNSITMFSQYLSESGIFINSGLNAGHTSWNADKSIVGIPDPSAYETDFYAAQINAGFRMFRNRISVAPQISVRYQYMSADKYVDAAAQTFDDWWFNTLNASAYVDLGFDFIGTDFIVRPNMRIGGGYDLISHGTDAMRVQLINGALYNIPIETPHRASMNGAIGVNFYTRNFAAGLNYQLDMRSDYVSHTIMAKLKIGF